MPKVSICIPAYNQVVYLKRTLDSILSQTYQDYEVIVTDDTPGFMVKELVEQYDFSGRLHYLKNLTSLGTPENWNEGIRKASGEYIKILHHDDWFTADNSLEQYVNLLSNNPGSALAFSGSLVLLPNGDNWVHQISTTEAAKIQSNPVCLFLENRIGSPSAVIYRKDVLEYFDNNLKWLVDVEFYIRVIHKFKKTSYSAEPLVTTFGAEGRVSDFCINNPQVEIFENFYVFDKTRRLSNFKNLIKSTIHLLRLCKRYGVSDKSQIRGYEFNGKISPLFLKLLKLYSK